MAVALLGTPGSNTPGVTSFDTSGNYTAFTYAVSAGSNRVLVLFVCIGDTQLTETNTASYGGQAGTQITGYLQTDANFVLVKAFYWNEAAIAAASNTTFTLSNWTSVNIIDQLVTGAAAFSGVDQATPFGTVVSATGTTGTTASTGSITCPANGLVIGSIATDSDNTLTEGQTLLFEVQNVGADTCHGAEYRSTTGALTWTVANNFPWAVAGVPVNPSGAAAETITMDKWFHRTEPLRRAKTVPVASGIIGIRNT